ncbi:hypothetical protein [Pseudomonas sp.]|uniref:hypothetical protein n=1 Tax=Pseudomonas sp. TaxID=306 RepID=UPI0028A2C91B|nr:hypothetical protein [Pseudomonas sp.]
MSTGFLAFKEDGAVMTDMTVFISQTMGSVDTNGTHGSATLPSLPPGKSRFYMIVALVDLNRERGKKPGVTITDNTMSWVYAFNTNGWGYFAANCRIYYGYY